MSAEPARNLPRVFTASPIGIVVALFGLAMTVWSFLRLGSIADHVTDENLRQVVDSLQIAVPALWLVAVLWGIHLIITSLERAALADRLDGQDVVLHRVEQALTAREVEKQELTQKSRSFWARIRNDPN